MERAMNGVAKYAHLIDRVPGAQNHIKGSAANAVERQIHSSNPVVLVPGYSSPWQYLQKAQRSLIHDGISTYIYHAPNNGLGDAREAAASLAEFGESVSRMHGGSAVDYIGHSRGGMIALDAARHHLPQGSVGTVITVGSPLNGVNVSGAKKVLGNLPLVRNIAPDSIKQLFRGSDYVNSLHEGRNLADEGVHLVSIYSKKFDGAVQPWDAHMADAGWTNRPIDTRKSLGHLEMMTKDPKIYDLIVSELEAGSRMAKEAAQAASNA